MNSSTCSTMFSSPTFNPLIIMLFFFFSYSTFSILFSSSSVIFLTELGLLSILLLSHIFYLSSSPSSPPFLVSFLSPYYLLFPAVLVSYFSLSLFALIQVISIYKFEKLIFISSILFFRFIISSSFIVHLSVNFIYILYLSTNYYY